MSVKEVIKYIRTIQRVPSDYQRSIGRLFYTQAICFYREGNMPMAHGYLDTSYAQFSAVNDTSQLVNIIGVRGAIAEFQR